MSGISPVRMGTMQRATAVVRLAPQKIALEGSATLPIGQAVPIGDLLGAVLSRYGLGAGEGSEQAAGEVRRDAEFDVLA
jgi:hypothetical protein